MHSMWTVHTLSITAKFVSQSQQMRAKKKMQKTWSRKCGRGAQTVTKSYLFWGFGTESFTLFVPQCYHTDHQAGGLVARNFTTSPLFMKFSTLYSIPQPNKIKGISFLDNNPCFDIYFFHCRGISQSVYVSSIEIQYLLLQRFVLNARIV